MDIRFSTIQELEWTYALLFRPSSSKQLKQLQKYADACRQSVDNNGKQDVTFQDETIISHTLLLNQSVDSSSTLVKMAVDPKRHPAKDILGNYFQCPISPAIQNVLNPGKARSKSAPITAAITASPPYFEDMRFQMCATFRIEFRDQEGFDRFPYFGDRLRQLKTYMDMQKPRTFRQMWKDSRDSTSWWTFWAVLFFGGASVFLALASLSVSIAQTVGTFQASR